ncbi:MAG: cobalamin B12-binding domain-containing protein [Sinobacteraceae bacterium]|nr:cobalamin B12-binding domain-containing protein [Nevskiaceae bacterium]
MDFSSQRGPPRSGGRQTLLHTIEGEVIPRLLLAHRRQGSRVESAAPDRVADGDSRPATTPTPYDISHLAELVLRREKVEAERFVAAVRGRGVDTETLLLDLLAPAARHLGAMWETECADFIGVTVGLRYLQGIAHDLSGDSAMLAASGAGGRRVLLVSLPGEQHVFGTQIVAEMLRRAHWDVWDAPGASDDDILTLVNTEWFAFVGVSIGAPEQLEALGALVRRIRRSSLHRGIRVMVGGIPFSGHPDRVTQVGADATAVDAREAVAQAERLLEWVSQGN